MPEDNAEIRLAVTDAVAAFDRVLALNCRCVVEGGGAPSLDECVNAAKSGPTWVPCGTVVLARRDSPKHT